MGGRIELAPRLHATARLMGRSEVAYDIGSDHGLLPLFLVQEGLAQSALLCDVSAASLEKARANAAKHDLTHRVRFHVGDGLAGLSPSKDDCVGICGMGGVLEADLLRKSAPLPCPVVLQANSERFALRTALAELGYLITDEDMVCDAGRFYAIIRAQRGAPYRLSFSEALFGPVLTRKRPPAFMRFLTWRAGVINKALPTAQGDMRSALLAEMQAIEELQCRQG